ncbi:MAG: alpha/beta hydrolase [Candidatus Limnocylindria bacterium]
MIGLQGATDSSEVCALPLPGRIDEEVAAFNASVAANVTQTPSVLTTTPARVRAGRRTGLSTFAPRIRSEIATDRVIAAPGHDLILRVFRPLAVHGVYLHMHGGGFVVGAADEQDRLLEELARECSVVVVSVNYRLAPEDRYPAAVDDCEAAALWLIGNSEREFGTDRRCIGGESAGANLAVSTLVRLRERHRVADAYAAAILNYGFFDLSLTPSAVAAGEESLVLSTSLLRRYVELYVDPATRIIEPEASPLRAHLGGLPPALFTVGTHDPLLDDTAFMAARWASAGSAARLLVVPGALHGFLEASTSFARRSREQIYRFVTDRLRISIEEDHQT